MRFSPPYAAAIWSCQPPFSLRISRSTWIDSSANFLWLIILPFKAQKAFNIPTAKVLLVPKPDLAGRSPSYVRRISWISCKRIHSRIKGCSTSLTSLTRSNLLCTNSDIYGWNGGMCLTFT